LKSSEVEAGGLGHERQGLQRVRDGRFVPGVVLQQHGTGEGRAQRLFGQRGREDRRGAVGRVELMQVTRE
jgi:hypothetical protein